VEQGNRIQAGEKFTLICSRGADLEGESAGPVFHAFANERIRGQLRHYGCFA
jgi:hypothetical protein